MQLITLRNRIIQKSQFCTLKVTGFVFHISGDNKYRKSPELGTYHQYHFLRSGLHQCDPQKSKITVMNLPVNNWRPQLCPPLSKVTRQVFLANRLLTDTFFIETDSYEKVDHRNTFRFGDKHWRHHFDLQLHHCSMQELFSRLRSLPQLTAMK